MFHALMLKIGLGWVGGQIRDAAEGKKGPQLATLYAWFAGKKTITGALLACVAIGLLSMGQVAAAGYVALAAALLMPLGLVDAAWRSAPESLSSYRWYAFLRDHWGWVASGLGTLGIRFTDCSPDAAALLLRLHLTCAAALGIITVLGAVLGWAVGAAKLAPAPKGDGLILQVEAKVG